ncbi:MAG: YncE family protein [Parachlamydiales bacterium]|nr:YncE family protein [Parachlamydiales bacterium]
MFRNKFFVLLCLWIVNAFASKAYITDVFGSKVYAYTNGTIQLVSVASGSALFVSPSYVSTSPDGKLACVNDYGMGSGSVYLIDTTTNIAKAVNNQTGTPFAGTFSSAFSPTQQKAYAGTNVIYVIDTTTGIATHLVSNIPAMSSIFSLRFSNDGAYAYATDFSLGVLVIDTATDTVVSTITPIGVPAFAGADCVAMNPTNSDQSYVGDNGNRVVYVINNSTKQTSSLVTPAMGVPNFTSPYDLAYGPNGDRAYVADNNLPGVIVIDAITNQSIAIVTPGMGVPGFSNTLGVAVSPDNVFAFITDVFNTGVYYVDVATNVATMLIALPGASSTQGVAFIPAPLPPTNLSSSHQKNDFGLVYSLNTILKWNPSQSNVVLYKIYRNGQLVGSTPGLEFNVKDQSNGTYAVTSVDLYGVEGKPVAISIN